MLGIPTAPNSCFGPVLGVRNQLGFNRVTPCAVRRDTDKTTEGLRRWKDGKNRFALRRSRRAYIAAAEESYALTTVSQNRIRKLVNVLSPRHASEAEGVRLGRRHTAVSLSRNRELSGPRAVLSAYV